MSNQQNKVPDFQKIGKKMISDATRIASVECLNFFTRSFEQHGWTDTAFQPWPARKSDGEVGGNLMQPTGNLRDSLQILQRSGNKGWRKIILGTDVPYAQIHNEGGYIRETVQVKAHSRKRSGRQTRGTGTIHVKSHSRRMNLKIPARPFLGESKTLVKKIEKKMNELVNSNK